MCWWELRPRLDTPHSVPDRRRVVCGSPEITARTRYSPTFNSVFCGMWLEEGREADVGCGVGS